MPAYRCLVLTSRRLRLPNKSGGRLHLCNFAFSYASNLLIQIVGDTVEAWQLVRPNGEITTVTEASDPDAAFLLRGGFNNIGIVTSFTLRTFPQPNGIWGGVRPFLSAHSPSRS